MSHRNNQKQCRVCFSTKDTEIFVECCSCGLGVHGSCYGCSFTANSRASPIWKCRFCHAIATQKVAGYDNSQMKAIKCRICNQTKFGALKSCGKNQGFAHLVCALWTPFIFLENEYNMAPIKGIEKCQIYKSALDQLICQICRKSHATVKCRFKCCKKHYHPLCLMEKYRHCMMERDGVIDNAFLCKIYYVYCPEHVQLHQDWDYNEGHKRMKSREVLFDETTKQLQSDDIRMTEHGDCDSDIVILSSTNCSKQCSDRNNEETLNTDTQNMDELVRSNVNVHGKSTNNAENQKQFTSKPMTPAPQQVLNQSFLDHMYTPSPSIQMDVASQWTERFQDQDSIFGFGDNFLLRDQSPLMMMMTHEMSPTFFDHNNDTQHMSNYYDPHDKDTMDQSVFNARDLNRNGLNTNNESHTIATTPHTPQTRNHSHDSMYLMPKLSNNRSLGTPNTNSTFDTNASPHTVGSFASLPTPPNGDAFRFAHISGEI